VGVLSLGQPPQAQSVDVRSFQLNGGEKAPLSGSPLTIRLGQQFLVRQQVSSSSIIVTAYNYTIEHPSEGEVVSFQWHLGGETGIDFPHVHIGPAMSRRDSAVRAGEAHKIHLPTGEVSLADVLRLAITELEVEPRRDDWEALLSHTSSER